MNTYKKYLLISLISISIIAFATFVANAWTNPGGNPTTVSGVLYFSGGNVGVGAAPTTYKLDVQGGQINSSGGLCIAGDCKTLWSQVGGGSTISAANVSANVFGANTGKGNYEFQHYNSTADVMYIDATNDRVGIGTASPGAKLEVRNQTLDNTAFQTLATIYANVSNESDAETFIPANSSFGLSFKRNWAGSGANTNVAGIYGFSSSNWRGGMVFRTKNNTSSSGDTDINAMVLSPAGNVGIGTASPGGKLEISSTMNAAPTTGSILLTHPSNYQRSSIVFPSRINWTSDYGFIEYRDDDNDSGEAAILTVGTSNDADDDVLLDPSGRLRIDATNATLDVSGNLTVPGTITAVQFVGGGAGLTGITASSIPWTGVTGKPTLPASEDGTRDASDFNAHLSTGFFNAEGTPPNSPGGSYGQLIVARGIDTGLQIYGGYTNDQLWFRGWSGSGSTFYAWRTIIHSGNIGSQSVNYATTAGSAPPTAHDHYYTLGTYNSGGTEAPSYFGSNKLKLQMLTCPWTWCDTLWMSSYAGGDVKGSNQLVFSKYGANVGFRRQAYDSGTWGTLYEFIHSGNIGSQSVNYATTAGSASNVTGGSISGNMVASNYGIGIMGVYSDVRYQAVWSMGTSWLLPADGTTPGNLYGLAWTHSNIGGQSKAGLSHQLLVMENGITKVALGSGIWTSGGGYFAGDVTAASFIYGSDRSLKKNITTIDNPLDKIMQLRGVTFDWKKDNTPGVGLIAQEVEKVFPELVTGEEGQKGVQYGNLVAPLIEAVKEQQKEIDQLEARIKILEERK